MQKMEHKNISNDNGGLVVLMDNENRKSKFLNDLDQLDKNMWCQTSCRFPIQIKMNSCIVFNIKIIGLLLSDVELDNHIKPLNGIIILVDYLNLDNNIYHKIKDIIHNNPKLPLLIIIEKYVDCKVNSDPCHCFKEFTAVNHRRSCFIDFGNILSSHMTDTKNHEKDEDFINDHKEWFYDQIQNNFKVWNSINKIT